MNHEASFSILDSVDSTNNYAMGMVHAGMAKHGQAWFAKDQTAGKGQRGNNWQSAAGDNIILTVTLQPGNVFPPGSFYFNAFVALTCLKFLKKSEPQDFFIKWPNDLYWRDRKAGGILIENIIQGNNWRWAIVGIGININQDQFPEQLKNPVSLKGITGQSYDTIGMAMQLHKMLVEDFEQIASPEHILQTYNENLYLRGQQARLKKGNSSFATTIKEVDAFGRLHTRDTMDRSFEFGEVSWL